MRFRQTCSARGERVPVEREERIADAGMREGAFVEKDGGLFTVSDGALVKPEWADKPKKVRQAEATSASRNRFLTSSMR